MLLGFCDAGGWEDFFEVDRRLLVPLTADANEADWQNCTRLTVEIVYQMLTDAQTSQLFTMEMGARLVSSELFAQQCWALGVEHCSKTGMKLQLSR